MANEFEFIDNRIEVSSAIEKEIIAFLHEASGELVSQTQRNSAVGKIGGGQTKGDWRYEIDKIDGVMQSVIGNPNENAVWEEFGTGDYALNGDGSPTPWYIPIGTPDGISQAVVDAYGMKVVHGKSVNFVKSYGKKPKRMFHNAFTKLKSKIQNQLGEHLKRMGG